MFCCQKKECWAHRNNRCLRQMRWSWPGEAYVRQRNSKPGGHGQHRAQPRKSGELSLGRRKGLGVEERREWNWKASPGPMVREGCSDFML